MNNNSFIPSNEENKPAKQKEGKYKMVIIILCSLLLICVVGSIYIFIQYKSKDADSSVKVSAKSEPVPVLVDSAKIAELKPFFKEQKDEFINGAWIIPKVTPPFKANAAYTYFRVTDEGKPKDLRILLRRAGTKFLVMQKFIFLIDGKTYDYTPQEVKRDYEIGWTWEWSEDQVSYASNLPIILSALKNAKDVKLRVVGDKYVEDYGISHRDIALLVKPYEYYLALGGIL